MTLAVLVACRQTAVAPDGGSQETPTAQVRGGHDMNAVDITGATRAPVFARGQRPWRRVADGVKEFRLFPGVVSWSILPTVQVGAYAYNGMVPGPLKCLNVGDKVRIVVENRLPEPTSVHWHGLQIDNAQDGAAGVTQPPSEPGATFVYEWTVPATPGTFFYHSHFQADRQQALGLCGALLIDGPTAEAPKPTADVPILLGEWHVAELGTLPAMDFSGMEPNYFTINGKSYPEEL